MAFVSFSRCSSDLKSSAGPLAATGAGLVVGGAALAVCGVAGLGGMALGASGFAAAFGSTAGGGVGGGGDTTPHPATITSAAKPLLTEPIRNLAPMTLEACDVSRWFRLEPGRAP